MNGTQKKDLYSNAHIFCLPTYYPWEGQPFCILEAYAAGCVVITTNHSGISQVFKDGINGIEVEKKSTTITETKGETGSKRDDLKIVEGIGLKIEQLLYNRGVYTFVQLAAMKPTEIKEILEAGGPRYHMHDPHSWPEQAKLAAEGRWGELKAWQDVLKGGK